jgi:hypothetical protein
MSFGIDDPGQKWMEEYKTMGRILGASCVIIPTIHCTSFHDQYEKRNSLYFWKYRNCTVVSRKGLLSARNTACVVGVTVNKRR